MITGTKQLLPIREALGLEKYLNRGHRPCSRAERAAVKTGQGCLSRRKVLLGRGAAAEMGKREAPGWRAGGRHGHVLAAHRTFCYLVPTVCQAGVVLGSTHSVLTIPSPQHTRGQWHLRDFPN